MQIFQALIFCALIIHYLDLHQGLGIRFGDRSLPIWSSSASALPSAPAASPSKPTKTVSFALGSFWRAEAVFGCLPGVLRTTAGYAGGLKQNPEYRSTGDHAEAVEVEYDPQIIRYEQLLDVFWSSHDPTQVFGQGPDVGDQYRSMIFVGGEDEAKLATVSKEREQAKLKDTMLATEIQQQGIFYPAEVEHQKFELRRKPQLLQLVGTVPDEEFARSRLMTKLNAYAAGMCPSPIQKVMDAKITDFRKNLPKLDQILSS